MDTKYWIAALNEFNNSHGRLLKLVDLTTHQLSWLLQRAQQLKDEDKNRG